MDPVATLETLPVRRIAAALAVLAAVGVAGGYGVAARSRPRSLRVPVSSSAPAHGPQKPAGRPLLVHVAGAVAEPGVYRLADGARVEDAVRAAGGGAPDADLDALNLAARVRDGDKVVVARRAPPAGHVGGGASTDQRTAPARVNLNTATVAELDTLPGIGPALAQRILAFREEHGGFRSVRDLLKVPGIGPSKFESLEDLVSV